MTLSPRRRAAAAAIAIALLAALGLIWATGHGIAASRDSVNYFHFTRVLLRQESVQTPVGPQIVLTHYPPIYPSLLAIGGAMKIKLLHAARWISVLCLPISLLLAAAILWRATASAPRVIVGVALLALQPAFIGAHLWAASEPPYFIFELITIWMLLEYAKCEAATAWRFAAAAGLALAGGMYTRYIGGALVPAACITVLLSARPLKDRLRDLGVLIACFAIPMTALALVQHQVLAGIAHRSIEYHPLTADHFASFFVTLRNWFTSADFAKGAAPVDAFVIFILVALLLFFHRRRTPLLLICVPAVVIYAALLLFSVAFIDNATPVDDRLLSPVALLLLLWILTEMPSPEQGNIPLGWRLTAMAVLLVAIPIVGSSGAVRLTKQIINLRLHGLGFDNVAFRNSPLVEECRKLPASAVIYSNFAEAIFLHADHDAYGIPGHPTAIGRSDEPLNADFERMRNVLSDGGYVAYFGFRAGRSTASVPVTVDELMAQIRLKRLLRTTDGTLYRVLPTPAASQAAATTTAVP